LNYRNEKKFPEKIIGAEVAAPKELQEG